ncbi:Protein of unknown function [Gryllus bimaculatus]|nr:Protein of unknown function [Gryllus bimaculatus]
MNAELKRNLELLGFSPGDYENCDEFHLLLDVLSNIDSGNILTREEVECLEYAEAVGLEDGDVAKTMQENGINEDVLDIDETAIENLQKKLRSLESYVWDNSVDHLRQQRGALIKTQKELKEKLGAVEVKAHIRKGEDKWRQNWLELQLLFQELNSINSNEDYDFPFSEKDLNGFVELVTQHVKTTCNWIGGSTCGELQENRESSVAVNNYDAESDMLMQLVIVKPRLNRAQYSSLQGKENEHIGHNEKLLRIVELQLQDILSNPVNEDLDTKKLESYYSDILNLSDKQTKLEIKEKGILHVLECIKAHRETCVAASKTCIDILQKLQVLVDLMYVVKVLWDQPRDAVHQSLVYCYEYFHQEMSNMKARITSLEEHKKKFEMPLVEKNVHPQMLQILAKKYFPTEEQSLQDFITKYEYELDLTISEKKKILIGSKVQLLEIEKDISRIEEDLDFNMEKLSPVSLGFTASLETLQTRKDEREDLNTSIALSPREWRRRLLWVYFLTDPKKLQDMKEELEGRAGNISPSPPSFVNNLPRFASTPKAED